LVITAFSEIQRQTQAIKQETKSKEKEKTEKKMKAINGQSCYHVGRSINKPDDSGGCSSREDCGTSED